MPEDNDYLQIPEESAKIAATVHSIQSGLGERVRLYVFFTQQMEYALR